MFLKPIFPLSSLQRTTSGLKNKDNKMSNALQEFTQQTKECN